MARTNLTVEAASREVRDLPKLMREWPLRARKLRSQFSYLATEAVFKEVLGRIPGGQYATYRKSLELVKVVTSPEFDAFAVQVNPKAVRVKKVMGRRALLYVKPKGRSRKVRPEIALLESYNPWTLDSLPFKPEPKYATLVARQASRREVLKASDRLRKSRPQWSRKLTELGIRSPKKNAVPPVPKGVETLPDVSLDALRLEFGWGGEEGKAHWRPAISWLQRRGVRVMLREHRVLRDAMIKSQYQGWKRWPPTIPKVSSATAKKFLGFQKRLGIRVQQ